MPIGEKPLLKKYLLEWTVQGWITYNAEVIANSEEDAKEKVMNGSLEKVWMQDIQEDEDTCLESIHDIVVLDEDIVLPF